MIIRGTSWWRKVTGSSTIPYSQWGLLQQSKTVAGWGVAVWGAASPRWACLFTCLLVHDREFFLFSFRGFLVYFWASRLFPPVFLPFFQCVCLSTQRLTALSKGKILRWRWEGKRMRVHRDSSAEFSSVTNTERPHSWHYFWCSAWGCEVVERCRRCIQLKQQGSDTLLRKDWK